MSRVCKICSRQSGELITLFSFPTNEDYRNQWSVFCKTKCEDLKTNDRLCSLHFHPSAFKISLTKTERRLKLRPNVVPTIFDTVGNLRSGPSQNNKQVKGDESKKKTVNLYCCLCGALKSKIPRFSFPIHDTETTEKWLTICGFKKKDLNLNVHRVCMQHFTNDDFLKRTNDKQRLLLKPRAVPSAILNQVENTIHGNENLEEPHFTDATESLALNQLFDTRNHNNDELQERFPQMNSSEIMYLHETEAEPALYVVDCSEDIEETEDPLINTPDLLQETPRSTKRNRMLSETEGYLTNLPSRHITPQTNLKRKYPQYIKDINTPDCGGSKKAKMILDVARKNLARSRQRSHILKQQNLRLHKRLMTMKKTIELLKNQNFLLERSFSDILARGFKHNI